MKKTIKFALLIVLCSVAFACNNGKKTGNGNNEGNDSLNTNGNDSTIYATCVEAAMSSIVALNEAGDTLKFVLETPDTIADVQGGVFPGDKLAIVATKTTDGLFAQKVINLTSLLGKWTSIDKNFDIKEGGIVESHVEAETKPYTSWKIYNGNLILSQDTFSFLTLGPDSLLLENSKGIFAYKRQEGAKK